MIKYLLFKPLGPEDLPTLKELTTSEICKVWAGASRYIRRQLLQKRAVEIGVGTFALVPAHATVGEDKALPVERPVFRPCRLLKKFYKLKCAKTKIPDETPFVQLDFEQIASEIHFRREIVERCIHETLLFFAGALRDNKEVEFSFKGIGILAVRRKVVSMTFLDDCLLELDGTGNMLAALLGDSKMMRTVAFAGKNDFSRLSRDEVITLPRLAVETPHQPSAPAISLKPRREPAPWGGGARRVSVLDPVFLAQRRVSLARQRAKEGERATAKEAGQARVLPVIREKSQEEPKQPRPPAQPRLQLPACVPQPSGTGTGSLRTERAEKRLRLLMASKRREVEADVWRQYRANRAGRNTERGQSPCRHVFEDPCRPPHLLRKAYAEKLKEGLQEKERCQGAARQRASEGPAELHLPGRAWAAKGEKTRLLERRGKAQGLPATPRS
ncbi:coiled-coil domain-containing protein 81-like [Aquila chrysaetos chrysaetos]|uniref:coiled-coil domain-containing protein 81-like n=1 Tax=Aquila chrysaetos chrysaetos TaxID=223781 RepID=UPI001176B4FF|nr:coiled-coil domain-containing protein 81-like [Aquila chrysaetos chrysaetos]